MKVRLFSLTKKYLIILDIQKQYAQVWNLNSSGLGSSPLVQQV